MAQLLIRSGARRLRIKAPSRCIPEFSSRHVAGHSQRGVGHRRTSDCCPRCLVGHIPSSERRLAFENLSHFTQGMVILRQGSPHSQIGVVPGGGEEEECGGGGVKHVACDRGRM